MAIPVTLADARRQVRLEPDDTSMDVELADFIADAAAWVERYTGHILIARDVTEEVRTPGRTVVVRAWPIRAGATVAATADATPIVGLRLDLSSRPARILPAAGTLWPLSCAVRVLQITVRAGYEDDDVVPRNLRRAMLILISAYDSDREGGDIFEKAEAAARRLCRDFRMSRV